MLELNRKEVCCRYYTHVKFTFLLEIYASFKECLHDNVRRIPMSQGSIYILKLYCECLWRRFYYCCEVCFSLMQLYDSGGDISVIVINLFFYCSVPPHLFLVVKFAFLQCSCMAVEDINMLFCISSRWLSFLPVHLNGQSCLKSI